MVGKALAASAIAALVAGVTPASASVIYTFDSLLADFSYTAPSFIGSKTTINAPKLDSCDVFLSKCNAVTFSPDVVEKAPKGKTFTFDEITFSYSPFGAFPVSTTTKFAADAFDTLGKHKDVFGLVTLTVTNGVAGVPLPPAAPMFGAALLVLAGFGYGMNRWVAPKATTKAA